MEATVLSVGKSVLNGALGYAKSKVAEEVALQLEVESDQAFITDELEIMQSFLMTAHNERDDNKVVNTWVKQVGDMAYDVEDCLQEFAIRLEKRSWWGIPFMLLGRRSVAKQMKELRVKVEDVSQRNVRYRLIRGSGSKPTATAVQSTISTEVLLHVAEAARTALQKKEKMDLAKLITENENGLRVVAVWGASNDVGVTSIIRSAFDNQHLKEKFQCRAWVRLMHPFNPNDFFGSLVRQFYEDSSEETGKITEGATTGLKVFKKMAAQDNLVDEFNRYVTEKRYLVVITNVSTIEEWDWIKTYFPSKNGSRIIVSTQQFEVASLCTEQPYTISEIDQKWSFHKEFYVFYKKVDASTKENDRPEFSSKAEIGNAEPTCASTITAALDRASTIKATFDEEQLIDRATAKAEVMKLIDQGGEVITICGMGGLGKTTLVRSVYQQELGERFHRHAWLTISHSFNKEGFHRNLFRQLCRDYHEEKGKAGTDKESKLQEKKDATWELMKILLEKKCLIVLDDLSSIGDWELIKKLLPTSRNKDNRIIVTTRELTLAKYASGKQNNIYNLELLYESEALLLFEKKVFKDITERNFFVDNPDMIEQANLILKKCGGLPLAISTIGSFLATKPKTAMEWRDLNKHISAELEVNPELGMIKTVLTSNYDGLPYHLKLPFLYFSIFPEDHDTRWARLVRRWIAEGYARGIRNKTAVEIGNSYITELINRSIVMPSKGTALSTRGIRFLRLHDLIREIGISKSTEENLVFTLEEGCNLNAQGKIRHLTISSSWTRDKNAFDSAVDLSHIRSLTVFGGWESFFISDKMRVLRVLDLEDAKGLEDRHLHQIVKLFHLKYLSLRRCHGILRLPNSLGNLRHLQTLDVRGTAIIELPRTIIKLQKLQYLRVGFMLGRNSYPENAFDGTITSKLIYPCCISYLHLRAGCMLIPLLFFLVTSLIVVVLSPVLLLLLIWRYAPELMKDGFVGVSSSFKGQYPRGVKFPRGIRKLKALHTMGVVNIDGGNAIIQDIHYLTGLRKLRVTGLKEKNFRKFFTAIAEHKCLESLSVQFGGEPGPSGCSDIQSLPPQNLQSLKLYGNLVKLPEWIEGLRNLVKLKLTGSKISEHDAALQIFGKLPNLSILNLCEDSFDGREVHLNFQRGSFPSLLVLGLDELYNLKSVEFEGGATPKMELLQFSQVEAHGGASFFAGLQSLKSLKEVVLSSASYQEEFMEGLQHQLAANSNLPVLKRGSMLFEFERQ